MLSPVMRATHSIDRCAVYLNEECILLLVEYQVELSLSLKVLLTMLLMQTM